MSDKPMETLPPEPRAKVAVDWAAIYRRLDEAEAASSGIGIRSAEQSANILRERALALAKTSAVQRESEKRGLRNILIFTVGGEPYGIPTEVACEILSLDRFTTIPRAPRFVVGVMNRRGQILMLADLRHLLRLPAAGIADLTKVIVIGNNGGELGLVAESVVGVAETAATDIAPPLVASEYVEGIMDGRCTLLTTDTILRLCKQRLDASSLQPDGTGTAGRRH
jgi:purine-binding chemotaxis protein CheW